MKKFLEPVLPLVPRILGLIDRDTESKTFGCSDRYYWHYKIYDFSNARFQEASLFLTLLYLNNFEGNIYFQNKKVFQWIFGTIQFWAKLNKNGYLNEVYPYERSFCATAFSAYAITESLLLTAAVNPQAVSELIKSNNLAAVLKRTGSWLKSNINMDVANQMAAAAAALYNICLILEDNSFKSDSNKIINIIDEGYSKHGCCLEYGGFDIGYSSITASLLSVCENKAHDAEIFNLILKINSQIENYLDDNANYDFSINKRKTQFLYPYSFAKTRNLNVINKILNGISANAIITPLWLDDRYCIALASDYLFSYIELSRHGTGVNL